MQTQHFARFVAANTGQPSDERRAVEVERDRASGRRQGVTLPSSLKQEPHVRLNVSYRFDPPDLAVNEWGVRATLTFPTGRYTIAVPWNALFALTSHVTKDFWFYPEDMPQELFDQNGDQKPSAKAEATELRAAPQRPALKIAKPPEDAPPAAARIQLAPAEVAQIEAPQEVRPAGRSHLRLVK